MKRLLAALVLALCFAPAWAHADDNPAAAFSYPVTFPARHAMYWFQAYAKGDSAMHDFWIQHGAASAMALRPVEVRLQVTHEIREQQGDLTPVGIDAVSQDYIDLRVRNQHGEQFRMRFQCEPASPYGLLGIRLMPIEADAGNGEDAATAPPPTDPQIVAALAAQVDSVSRTGVFSGGIALDKDGAPLYVSACGRASAKQDRPNDLDTRYDLGSINKLFTQVAIQQLAQAGRLSLDDTLGRWLRDYRVPGGSGITLRLLLDHRAGVPDMFRNPATWKHPERIRSMADWYALVRELPLRFAPGTQEEYSNGGYVLLGMVVAAASGEDYYAYVRRHIYEVAGMTQTGSYAVEAKAESIATGYTTDAGARAGARADTLNGRAATTALTFGRGSSAGGGYSTTGDLVRFARALRGGKLLDAEHTRAVLGEHGAIAIAGGSPGVNALLVIAGPYTFVALSNFDPPAAERFMPTIGRMLRRAAGIPAAHAQQPPASGGGNAPVKTP